MCRFKGWWFLMAWRLSEFWADRGSNTNSHHLWSVWLGESDLTSLNSGCHNNLPYRVLHSFTYSLNNCWVPNMPWSTVLCAGKIPSTSLESSRKDIWAKKKTFYDTGWELAWQREMNEYQGEPAQLRAGTSWGERGVGTALMKKCSLGQAAEKCPFPLLPSRLLSQIHSSHTNLTISGFL